MKTCTLVSPVTVAIFSGPAKLSPEFIKEAESGVHGKFSIEEVHILKIEFSKSDTAFVLISALRAYKSFQTVVLA